MSSLMSNYKQKEDTTPSENSFIIKSEIKEVTWKKNISDICEKWTFAPDYIVVVLEKISSLDIKLDDEVLYRINHKICSFFDDESKLDFDDYENFYIVLLLLRCLNVVSRYYVDTETIALIEKLSHTIETDDFDISYYLIKIMKHCLDNYTGESDILGVLIMVCMNKIVDKKSEKESCYCEFIETLIKNKGKETIELQKEILEAFVSYADKDLLHPPNYLCLVMSICTLNHDSLIDYEEIIQVMKIVMHNIITCKEYMLCNRFRSTTIYFWITCYERNIALEKSVDQFILEFINENINNIISNEMLSLVKTIVKYYSIQNHAEIIDMMKSILTICLAGENQKLACILGHFIAYQNNIDIIPRVFETPGVLCSVMDDIISSFDNESIEMIIKFANAFIALQKDYDIFDEEMIIKLVETLDMLVSLDAADIELINEIIEELQNFIDSDEED